MSLQSITSGDNVTGHAISAATIAEAVSPIIVWILQVAHLNPPTQVDQGITALCFVGASYIMQKISV